MLSPKSMTVKDTLYFVLEWLVLLLSRIYIFFLNIDTITYLGFAHIF